MYHQDTQHCCRYSQRTPICKLNAQEMVWQDLGDTTTCQRRQSRLEDGPRHFCQELETCSPIHGMKTGWGRSDGCRRTEVSRWFPRSCQSPQSKLHTILKISSIQFLKPMLISTSSWIADLIEKELKMEENSRTDYFQIPHPWKLFQR